MVRANYYNSSAVMDTAPLAGPEMVYSLLLHPLRFKKSEEFWLLALDADNRYLKKVVLKKGNGGKVSLCPRAIIKKALSLDAAAIIMAHNHPGEKASPTPADRAATNKLQEAFNSLNILLHDHIVVGVDGYFSFRDEGII